VQQQALTIESLQGLVRKREAEIEQLHCETALLGEKFERLKWLQDRKNEEMQGVLENTEKEKKEVVNQFGGIKDQRALLFEKIEELKLEKKFYKNAL